MFSNTDRTDVRIANIADNHHAEIRRITVIPTEITVSAYPSRRMVRLRMELAGPDLPAGTKNVRKEPGPANKQ